MVGGNDWQDTSGGDPADSDTATIDETTEKLQRPRRYKVLLHNDDYTTMEFVVLVLVNVFHLSEEQAVEIMLHVHQHDVGVAGVYSYEVAETKVNKVISLAREYEFPLRCTSEAE